MRERYAQTVLTFRITNVCTHNNLSTQSIAKKKISPKLGHYKYIDPKMCHAEFSWPFSLDSGPSTLFYNPSSLLSTKHPTTRYRIQSTFRLDSQQFMGPLQPLPPPDLIHVLNQLTQPKSHILFTWDSFEYHSSNYTQYQMCSYRLLSVFFTFFFSTPKTN